MLCIGMIQIKDYLGCILSDCSPNLRLNNCTILEKASVFDRYILDFDHNNQARSSTVQEFLQSMDRLKCHITRVIEGFETVMFRSKFESWPQTTEVAVAEEGRGKVAG